MKTENEWRKAHQKYFVICVNLSSHYWKMFRTLCRTLKHWLKLDCREWAWASQVRMLCSARPLPELEVFNPCQTHETYEVSNMITHITSSIHTKWFYLVFESRQETMFTYLSFILNHCVIFRSHLIQSTRRHSVRVWRRVHHIYWPWLPWRQSQHHQDSWPNQASAGNTD